VSHELTTEPSIGSVFKGTSSSQKDGVSVYSSILVKIGLLIIIHYLLFFHRFINEDAVLACVLPSDIFCCILEEYGKTTINPGASKSGA
jgi:hypothetical protein